MFLGWLFPAVGVVNVRTAFKELVKAQWGEATLTALEKTKGVRAKGFAKWFHQTLGKTLIATAGRRAMAKLPAGRKPHWMSKRERVHWERRC